MLTLHEPVPQLHEGAIMAPQKWKEENSDWERETLSNLFFPDQGLQTPSVLLSQFGMSGVEQ